ncbi:hypothetical protein FGG08_000286 [Glutinoglossum americanum]|uniref:Fe2OG dioxygenase domain-containing protein n=1 Tax=Glutinoglossum americanum TaxID=1670608 RepID=A0A9P8L6Z0_9PEZI|nr:hypothetical protein FGG08_000286 [Glutinoglossum americanum]
MSLSTELGVQIPVIDIANPTLKTGEELVDAAARYGFVFIRNQGSDISPPEIDKTFETVSTLRLDIPQFPKPRKTLDPKNQRRGDFKEAFNLGEFHGGKAQQPLPDVLIPHEAELGHFTDRCHELCMKILRLFALGLKISPDDGGEDWFLSRHDTSRGPSGSILRLLHYPALLDDADYIPDVDIRAGAHSDYGSITLLFQLPGQPGLEILTPPSTWSPVPVSPLTTASDPSPPILVNIGDLLSYWTNGLLKSTVHRVVFPPEARRGGEDRYSVAYFCHPVNDTKLVPVPSEAIKGLIGGDGAAGGADVMTADEYLKSRLAATYGWGGKK